MRIDFARTVEKIGPIFRGSKDPLLPVFFHIHLFKSRKVLPSYEPRRAVSIQLAAPPLMRAVQGIMVKSQKSRVSEWG
jgi:hypothetical protein